MTTDSTSQQGSEADTRESESGIRFGRSDYGPTSCEQSAITLSTASEQRGAFDREGYVKIDFEKLFPDLDFGELQSEVGRLAEAAVARDFDMPTWGTPRRMSVLGAQEIRKRSQMLFHLYES